MLRLEENTAKLENIKKKEDLSRFSGMDEYMANEVMRDMEKKNYNKNIKAVYKDIGKF
jgi:hypothetical protein